MKHFVINAMPIHNINSKCHTCAKCVSNNTIPRMLTVGYQYISTYTFMPIKFEVGIPVAKFVSRTIVDSFLAHFIITVIDWLYSDYILFTNFHRQLVHEHLSMHFSTMVVWTTCISPLLFAVL